MMCSLENDNSLINLITISACEPVGILVFANERNPILQVSNGPPSLRVDKGSQ